jgi:monoamine oxidase
MGRMQPDVVIVGAGAAGVGAGLELQARGVPFVILEAADRVGGRAFTDHASLPGHWDQGCHWFHSADVNPLVAWADRLGSDYEVRESFGAMMVWQGGRWLERGAAEAASAAIDAAIGAIYTGAEALGDTGGDRSVAEVLPRGGDWAGIVRSIARLMTSADPEDVSMRGYADYADTEVNRAVRGGLGDLIGRMAAGLPVRLGTPVTAIAQRAGGVRVTTAAGEIDAKAVVVTASTNVLASGTIRIDSADAAAVLERVGDVPCGAYEKIALALRRPPVDVAETRFCWIEPGDGGRGLNFQFAPAQAPIVIAHVGGTDARDLARAGEAAMVDLATERLVEAFGAGIRGEIIGAAVTGWQANPWVRGAYSYTRPGGAARRHEMIAADTGDIVFAGEAFSTNSYSTAHGAYLSGRDVAGRLAARLAG